jgi:hypothetical protein
MIFSPKLGVCFAAVTILRTTLAANSSFNVQPFKIDLSSKIPRLNALVNNTLLPTKPLYPDVGPDKGIELDFLSELRSEWLGSSSFDWDTQQAELNQSVLLISADFVDLPDLQV